MSGTNAEVPANKNRHAAYLDDRQLSQRYSAHRTTIWRWAREGTFPQPVRLSPKCTRWRLVDIEEWERTLRAQGVQS